MTDFCLLIDTRYYTCSTTCRLAPLPGALQVGLCHSSVVDATLFSVMLHCSSRIGMYSDQTVPTTDCCLSSC
jgi:hypothetical protein